MIAQEESALTYATVCVSYAVYHNMEQTVTEMLVKSVLEQGCSCTIDVVPKNIDNF